MHTKTSNAHVCDGGTFKRSNKIHLLDAKRERERERERDKDEDENKEEIGLEVVKLNAGKPGKVDDEGVINEKGCRRKTSISYQMRVTTQNVLLVV